MIKAMIKTDKNLLSFFVASISFFRTKADQWRNEPNLTEYIELLRICVKIDQFNVNYKIKETIDQLHFVYYSFVNNPNVFEYFEQLIQIDRLTNQLTDDYGHSKLSFAKSQQFR